MLVPERGDPTTKIGLFVLWLIGNVPPKWLFLCCSMYHRRRRFARSSRRRWHGYGRSDDLSIEGLVTGVTASVAESDPAADLCNSSASDGVDPRAFPLFNTAATRF